VDKFTDYVSELTYGQAVEEFRSNAWSV